MDESPDNLDPEVEETVATSPEPGNHNPQAEETAVENPESAPVHPRDKWDPAWRILTNIFVVVALGLTLNLVPRFWAGGPSVASGLLTVIPAGLSLLFSKDFLDKASPTKNDINALLKNCRIIPPFLREEFLLIGSISFFVVVSGATCLSPQIAECFYYKPAEKKIKEKIADVQELSEAEAKLKVAIALNPGYADAHEELGWLYEIRQDLGAAIAEYRLAMQNGSDNARIRLARLYLLEALRKDDEDAQKDDKSKPMPEGIDAEIKLGSSDIAASILTQVYKKMKDLPDDNLDNQLIKRSYYTVLAWARLEQGRYTEATRMMRWAFEQNGNIKNYLSNSKNKQETEKNADVLSTTIYCVRAELLDRQSKRSLAERDWIECHNSVSPVDLDEDLWLGRSYKRLKL